MSPVRARSLRDELRPGTVRWVTWVIVVGVVGLLVGSAVASKQVLDAAPCRLRIDGDPDAAVDAESLLAMPGCVHATAIVTELHQEGMSRGVLRHRCRLDLRVMPPGGGAAVPAVVEVDLGVEQLAWWLPGSVVDVVVDGPAVGACRPLLVTTRARATGRAELPVTTVRGMPRAEFLEPADRVLPAGARRTTAVIGSIDVSGAPAGAACSVTLGLWVDGAYATTVSDRFRLDEVVVLARGATVPVTVDPTDRLRVVVDIAAATAELAARLPDARTMRRAVTALGLPNHLATLRSIESGRGHHGVRHEYVATVVPVGADGGSGAPLVIRLLLAVPDASPLVQGSVVLLDAEGRTVDLEATAAARVHCALSRR